MFLNPKISMDKETYLQLALKMIEIHRSVLKRHNNEESIHYHDIKDKMIDIKESYDFVYAHVEDDGTIEVKLSDLRHVMVVIEDFPDDE